MTDKDQSREQKISAQIIELQKIISENPKDLKKINQILSYFKLIGTWHVIDPMKTVLNSPNCPQIIQQKILELLGKIQDPRVISVLASYAEGTNKKLRNTAIKSLSLIKNPKVIPHLISAAHEDDKWLNMFTIHGLAKNATPKVVPPLIYFLGSNEEEIRKEAINALTRLKLDNVDELLIEALGSENRYIRFGAVGLLGTRKVRKSVEALVKVIGDEDRRLNLITCNSLSRISDAKSLLPLLERSLNEGTENNRYILCIQKMDDQILPDLVDIYVDDRENQYSGQIMQIISKYDPLKTHEFLLERKSNQKDEFIAEKLEQLIQQLDKK